MERKIKNLEEKLKAAEMAKRVYIFQGRIFRWKIRSLMISLYRIDSSFRSNSEMPKTGREMKK